MAEVFRHHRTVRFGECDPAGVVYYPVFFNWFHEAMEAWFEMELQVPYAAALKRFGFPAAETSATFRKPISMGERIQVELSVERLGRSSVVLNLEVCDEKKEIRATGSVRCVCISVEEGAFQFTSVEIPSNLRREMERFQKET